jgi:hypothetical protein
MGGGGGDLELSGGLPDAQTANRGQAVDWEDSCWPSKPFPLRSGPLQPGQDPLSDPFPLELSQGCQDVELELSGWRRAVDAFTKTDELNPESTKIL